MFYRDSDINFFELKDKYKTPFVVYDKKQFLYTINSLKKFFLDYEFIKFSYAVKASYSNFFIEELSKKGFGCDVSSVYEYKLIKNKKFKFITSTSPYYNLDDMKFFYDEGLILDFNSIDQINEFLKLEISKEIGVRVKVRLPEIYKDNIGSYGGNSRFGIELNDDFLEYILKNKLIIKNIHVHTGQMTPEVFLYKVKYLLKISEYLKNVENINLGGGLFSLLDNINELKFVLEEVKKEIYDFKKRHNRNINLIIEPGGAITTPFAYMITKVVSIQNTSNFKLVTVDSSAWNFLPWNIFKIENLNDSLEKEEIIIAGNSLFEGDYFGEENNRPKIHKLNKVSLDDKFIVYAVGGYTYTNSRKFNGIELPFEVII